MRSKRAHDRRITARLYSKIRTLERERDKALDKIATRDNEIAALKHEIKMLRLHIDRGDGVRTEAWSVWKAEAKRMAAEDRAKRRRRIRPRRNVIDVDFNVIEPGPLALPRPTR